MTKGPRHSLHFITIENQPSALLRRWRSFHFSFVLYGRPLFGTKGSRPGLPIEGVPDQTSQLGCSFFLLRSPAWCAKKRKKKKGSLSKSSQSLALTTLDRARPCYVCKCLRSLRYSTSIFVVCSQVVFLFSFLSSGLKTSL